MGPTRPSEVYFRRGLWGWIASQWQKLAMVWGFSDTIADDKSDTDTAAGTVILLGDTVPAGEVWIVENICAVNAVSACTNIRAYATVQGVTIFVIYNSTPAVGIWDVYNGRVTLAEGEKLSCIFDGCALHDVVRLRYCGYKMDVA